MITKHDLKVGDVLDTSAWKIKWGTCDVDDIVTSIDIARNSIQLSKSRGWDLNDTVARINEGIWKLVTKKDMTFKVGDRVKIKTSSRYYGTSASNPSYVEGTIYEITGSGTARVNWDNGTDNNYPNMAEHLELVTKGKIIGYKLLKDTPEAKAGTVVILEANTYTISKYKGCRQSYLKETVESQPEWFEPIYEAVKPTSVVVKTNAGDITVTKAHISFGNGEGLLMDTVSKIIKQVYDFKSKDGGYNVVIETFKVGCKTFHVNDIPKLEEAIKQVS